MAALTGPKLIDIHANNSLVLGSQNVDGDTTSEVFFGALLETGAVTAPSQPMGSAGTEFSGIALEATDEADKNIPIAIEATIPKLALAGFVNPALRLVGTDVYCVTDNIDDLRETGAGVKVGTIVGYDGSTWTVHFYV